MPPRWRHDHGRGYQLLGAPRRWWRGIGARKAATSRLAMRGSTYGWCSTRGVALHQNARQRRWEARRATIVRQRQGGWLPRQGGVVGRRYRDGHDVAETPIRAGLARDCRDRARSSTRAAVSSLLPAELIGVSGTRGCCSCWCCPQACWSTVRAPDLAPRPSSPPHKWRQLMFF